MLKLWQHVAAPDPHRDLFLERYSQILAWALKLTSNRREQAEDLVQDTFVFLVNSKPDLSRAHNLDAYLYALVRNLHRAQLQKGLRRAALDLAVLEFDSANASLQVVLSQDDEDQLRIQNELRRICDFALHRRETSRSGSVLLLRFFHGYYPREIASILRCSRAVVDERLSLARKECRAFLEPRTLEIVTRAPGAPEPPPEARLSHTVVTNEFLLAELHEMIFSAPKGPCHSRAQLREIYRKGSSGKPDQSMLAHIVCCAKCLDEVNGFLGLAKLADRDPNDTTGYGSAAGGSRAGQEKLHLNRSKRSSNLPTARQISQWEGHAAGILEHRPSRLRIAVNGQPLVTQVLNSEGSDLTVTVPIRDQVDFVEVLSEQDVRLAMLVVAEAPPQGDLVQTTEVVLSGDRMLGISLSFDSPWPTVHVTYSDPRRQAGLEGASDAIVMDGAKALPALRLLPYGDSAERFSIGGVIRSLTKPRLWLNPRILSSAVAILMIVVVLFIRTRETTASAAVLIGRAEEWQQAAAKPGMVLHRTFDLIERPAHSKIANRKRVDVWRRPDSHAKVSRLFDPSGKVLSSVRLTGAPASLTPANAWQFEPAPDSFRQLAGDLNRSRVEKADGQIELIADSVRLKLNEKTFAPTGEIVQTEDAEFEFKEISTEPVPESASPLALIENPPAVARLRGVEHATSPVDPAPLTAKMPSEAELAEAEISIRVILHDLKADLGEEIQIRRRGEGVEVAGVVDSHERKEQLVAGLATLPDARVSLLSPEDLSSSVNDRIAAALTAPPESARPMHPPLLETWLKTAHPDEAGRRAFAARMVDSGRDLARRALSVQGIARRYGNPSDPRIAGIVADHLNAIKQDLAALDREFSPALPRAADVSGAEPASWPMAADRLFENARALESEIVVLLTTTNVDGSDPQAVLRDCRRAQVELEAALSRLIRTE